VLHYLAAARGEKQHRHNPSTAPTMKGTTRHSDVSKPIQTKQRP
jgi:hypothetical protein